MDMKLVTMPVTDVDPAKAFYVDKLGFTEDVDVRPTEGMRVDQLAPQAPSQTLGRVWRILLDGVAQPDLDRRDVDGALEDELALVGA